MPSDLVGDMITVSVSIITPCTILNPALFFVGVDLLLLKPGKLGDWAMGEDKLAERLDVDVDMLAAGCCCCLSLLLCQLEIAVCREPVQDIYAQARRLQS